MRHKQPRNYHPQRDSTSRGTDTAAFYTRGSETGLKSIISAFTDTLIEWEQEQEEEQKQEQEHAHEHNRSTNRGMIRGHDLGEKEKDQE
jgi:hypothetical protein